MTQSNGFLQRTQNILVIRPGALGDFILTLPVLARLRRDSPKAHIEIMGYPHIAELAVGRHYADSIVRFDHPEVAYLFLRDTPPPEGLIKHLSRIDLIISFLQDEVFIENLRRVSTGQVISHDPLPKTTGATHITDHLLSALGVWPDVAVEEGLPRIFLTEADRVWASAFLDRHLAPSRPIVALHPGSGGRKKCWPVEGFICLAHYLRKELGVQLLLVSGPADEEVTNHFLNHAGHPPEADNLPLHNLPLPQLAAVLERCNLFVGNDSGVTHLAAATGTPTLSLFGPTDPAVWGPRGKGVRILQGKAECSPCSPEERRLCQGPVCMEVITVGQVISTAEEILCGSSDKVVAEFTLLSNKSSGPPQADYSAQKAWQVILKAESPPFFGRAD